MDITQFRKETSERSERQNWVLDELSASHDFYFAGFEGCNENSSFQATTLLDRSSIDVSGDIDTPPSIEQVKELINSLEGRMLQGKINFCSLLGLPYTYILYNYEHQFVLRYELTDNNPILIERYPSFEAFSRWIQSIKQWVSYKGFRESPDLPEFDKALRRAKCAWPTNVDCIAFSNDDQPVAIIEFQNAKRTGVRNHSNLFYFYPVTDDYYGGFKIGPDEQRWRSQEILRVQSGLPHYTIVWSQKEDIIIVKQLERVTFPDYSDKQKGKSYIFELGKLNVALQMRDKTAKNKWYSSICAKYSSYQLINDNRIINVAQINPPLNYTRRSFPYLYMHKSPEIQKGEVQSKVEEYLRNPGLLLEG